MASAGVSERAGGALTAGPDLAARSGSELVTLLRASWRQVSQAQAVYLAVMAELDRCAPEPDGDPDREWALDEIGAALTFTTRRADIEYTLARSLRTRLPQVWAALHAGKIDLFKARVFHDYLHDRTDPQIARICARLLPRATGWTTGQLAARLLREVYAIDPGYTRRRYERAVRERGVWGYLTAEGTAVLSATGLSPAEAAAAAGRLDRLAAAIRTAGHPATEYQLRADLFVRLLDGRYAGHTQDQIIAAMLADAPIRNGSKPGPTDPASANAPNTERADRTAPTPDAGHDDRPAASADTGDPDAAESGTAADPRVAGQVSDQGQPDRPRPVPLPTDGRRDGLEIRIGLTTLLGLDDHPAELPGWGPIPAEDARLLVARQHHTEWRYAVTDHRGYLRHGGLVRARPPRPPRTDEPPCRGGVVEIHVPAALLADLARCPDLPWGWAALVADIAGQYRQRRQSPTAADTRSTRFPGAGLRRHIEMRDRTCVAPGCRRPARACDQDHTVDWVQGGSTSRTNLGPLCPKHHAMKHRGRWRLDQPRAGLFRWRSPLGQVYWTRGEPIAPDLPEPVPGPVEEPEPEPADERIFPSFNLPPPRPPPSRPDLPPPVADPDEPPPF